MKGLSIYPMEVIDDRAGSSPVESKNKSTNEIVELMRQSGPSCPPASNIVCLNTATFFRIFTIRPNAVSSTSGRLEPSDGRKPYIEVPLTLCLSPPRHSELSYSRKRLASKKSFQRLKISPLV